jgi:5'-deoxynucleotidase YfbR-like HD superfamily hydrolase
VDRLDLPLLQRIGELKRLASLQPGKSIAQNLFLSFGLRILAGSPESWPSIIDRMVVQALMQSIGGAWDPTLIRKLGMERWREIAAVFLAEALGSSPSTMRDYYLAQIEPFEVDEPLTNDRDGRAAERLRMVCNIPRAGYSARGKAKCSPYPRETQGEHCLVVAVYAALLCRLRQMNLTSPVLMALFHHLSGPMLPNFDHEAESLLSTEIRGAIDRTAMEIALEDLDAPIHLELAHVFHQFSGSADGPEIRIFQEADILDRALQVDYYRRMAMINPSYAVSEYELLNHGRWYDFQHDLLRRYRLIRGCDSAEEPYLNCG